MTIHNSHSEFGSAVARCRAFVFSLSGQMPRVLAAPLAPPVQRTAVAARKDSPETTPVKKIQLSLDDALATMGVPQAARAQVKSARIATLPELRRTALMPDLKLMKGLSHDDYARTTWLERLLRLEEGAVLTKPQRSATCPARFGRLITWIEQLVVGRQR